MKKKNASSLSWWFLLYPCRVGGLGVGWFPERRITDMRHEGYAHHIMKNKGGGAGGERKFLLGEKYFSGLS